MTNRSWLIVAGALLGIGALGAMLVSRGWDDVPSGTDSASLLEPSAVVGQEPGNELFRVKGAAFVDTVLVVVTGSDPAVHVFDGPNHTSWGAKGEGPAEFASPESVSGDGGNLLVRDGTLDKIVIFDLRGRYLASRTLRPHVVNAFAVAGGDTIVGLSAHGQLDRWVARLRGEQVDTLVSYTLPPQLMLAAEGAPSLSLPPPYAPLPRWAALPDGRVAFWDGRSPAISLLNGGREESFPLPGARFPVQPADREEWLGTAIPRSFMGRPVFEPLREHARKTVQFPDSLPYVLDMLPDPTGGVWVRRTTAATGERWTRVGRDGAGETFQLPGGTRLLAIGETRLAALATDEDDVETVHLYARPAERTR